VIPEAVPYGYYNMRVIEAWFRSLEERPNGAGMFHFTWQPPWSDKPVEWDKMEVPRGSINIETPYPDAFMAGKRSADEKTVFTLVLFPPVPEGSLAAGRRRLVPERPREGSPETAWIGRICQRARFTNSEGKSAAARRLGPPERIVVRRF